MTAYDKSSSYPHEVYSPVEETCNKSKETNKYIIINLYKLRIMREKIVENYERKKAGNSYPNCVIKKGFFEGRIFQLRLKSEQDISR